VHQTGRLVLTEGYPPIAMQTFVRLIVLKQRHRWGYRTLVAQVLDSIHLRRFCQISLAERVPKLSPTARSKLPASYRRKPTTATGNDRERDDNRLRAGSPGHQTIARRRRLTPWSLAPNFGPRFEPV
jgi:Transposase domain (DUF772)